MPFAARIIKSLAGEAELVAIATKRDGAEDGLRIVKMDKAAVGRAAHITNIKINIHMIFKAVF